MKEMVLGVDMSIVAWGMDQGEEGERLATQKVRGQRDCLRHQHGELSMPCPAEFRLVSVNDREITDAF